MMDDTNFGGIYGTFFQVLLWIRPKDRNLEVMIYS